MLRSLEIRDLLIIDHLALGFDAGLNVLTGETGAGKSILLDALGFVLGWRGRADLVRAGAPSGEVSAVFDLPRGHPAQALLAEAGLPEAEELILRRLMQADGRTQAFVNDRRAGVELLRSLGEQLVELHGQNDDRGLVNPRGHRALLDAFAGHTLAPLRGLYAEWQAALAAESAAKAALAAAAAEEDFLRHAVAELEKLKPEPGEEAALDAERRLLQNGEKMLGALAQAAAALGEEGAEPLLHSARRGLEALAGGVDGALDGALGALERALTELGEAGEAVQRLQERLGADPARREALEDRLFALRALARKHGVPPDALAGLAAELRARLEALDAGGAGLARHARAVAEAEAAYRAEAGLVSKARMAAAKALDAAMAAELPPLKMERAHFATEITPGAPGPEGFDQVSFTAAPNPGTPGGPIAKIASGGEMSRFLLALKLCLTRGRSGGRAGDQVLIFDEIDRGVGGATADAVGKRLAAIAAGAQVLVVTHSPQVAARGAHHWRVEKSVEGGETRSRVLPLSPAARVEEIARMLAGDKITEAARAAASALLEG